MSTLVAQTISNGTVSTSSANVIQGSAKAWVNFNGSSAAMRASYNVTSITKNGTGDFTANFTNAFADANYSVVMSVGVTGGILLIKGRDATAPTTSSFRFVTFLSNGNVTDVEYTYLAFFR